VCGHCQGRGPLVKRRLEIATGYVGEWNLRKAPGSFRMTDEHGRALVGYVFKRAKFILGAKRRKGLRAIRVRVVLEVL